MFERLSFNNCTHSCDPLTGCALEGVASVIAGLRDVCIVIQSPQGCAATIAQGYDHHEIDFTRRKVACTRLFETDIILGASDKLKDMIAKSDEVFGTKVMFVIGTCAADITGEDLEGICRVMQPKINSKLIPVMAGGFRGTSYDGVDIGLRALTPFIKRPEQVKRLQRSVTLLAPQVSLNPTWRADLDWVIQVLSDMGVSVRSSLPRDLSIHDLRHTAEASAGILLTHDSGHKFALSLDSQFNIPQILTGLPLPIGLGNTARWLTAIGEYFGRQDIADRMIRDGEALVTDTLRKRGLMIIPRYRNCHVAVCADATFGIGLTRMLFEELEMIPELLLIRSASPEAKILLEQELAEMNLHPKVAFGVDGYQIKDALSRYDVDAVIGSSWETYIAQELDIKVTFDLLSPTNRDTYIDRPYFGYEGMLNILERMGNDWESAFRSKSILSGCARQYCLEV